MVSTALDSNILSALWSYEPTVPKVWLALNQAKQEGDLLISPIVYAELLAHPRVTEREMQAFFSSSGIAIDFRLGLSVWTDCG